MADFSWVVSVAMAGVQVFLKIRRTMCAPHKLSLGARVEGAQIYLDVTNECRVGLYVMASVSAIGPIKSTHKVWPIKWQGSSQPERLLGPRATQSLEFGTGRLINNDSIDGVFQRPAFNVIECVMPDGTRNRLEQSPASVGDMLWKKTVVTIVLSSQNGQTTRSMSLGFRDTPDPDEPAAPEVSVV